MALYKLGGSGTIAEIRKELDPDVIKMFNLDKHVTFANKLSRMAMSHYVKKIYYKKFWGYNPQIYELSENIIKKVESGEL